MSNVKSCEIHDRRKFKGSYRCNSMWIYTAPKVTAKAYPNGYSSSDELLLLQYLLKLRDVKCRMYLKWMYNSCFKDCKKLDFDTSFNNFQEIDFIERENTVLKPTQVN